MKPKTFLAIISTVVLGACAGGDGAKNDAAAPAAASGSGDGGAVVVKDFEFTPAELSVDAGGTVTWTNEDTVRHTVTSGDFSGAQNEADGEFSGDLAEKGSTFEHTFEEAGTYTYFCKQHNVMNATITVR